MSFKQRMHKVVKIHALRVAVYVN